MKVQALTNQVSRLERRINSLENLGRRFFWYRLLTVLIIGLIIFLAINLLNQIGFIASIILSIAIFSAVVYYHRRIDGWIRKFKLWKQIKAHQLAQIQLDWDNIPPSRLESYAHNHNPLQVDLDLSGNYSLHQLIDRTISIEGGNLLRKWLSQSEPNPEHIKKYQKIIKELVPLSMFRDKLTLNFQLISTDQLSGEGLLKWLTMPYPTKKIRRLLPISTALILINIALFFLNLFGYISTYWIITLILYAFFYFSNQKLLQAFLEAVVIFDTELDKFRTILDFIENYPFKDQEALKQLCAPIIDRNNPPSKILMKIKWATAAVGIRNNPVLMLLLNTIFPWDFYFSWLISRYQNELSIKIPIWIRIYQELDASISLANFAYINPEYIFPDFYETAQPGISPILEAHDIGHPLIHPQQKICNQFIINNLGDVFIITGSNMAGKSTFVKTIGINLVLAYAGGPVNARTLKSIFFRLHTCIKISDSITDGFSYFYSEVKCLKKLWDLTKIDASYPILFLIDEIFRGTNNRERLIGSQAYIQNISGKKCAGIIATHDLELAKLANYNEFIKNFHFRDDVKDGKLIFDYKLRSGPSPTTNALKIMEMEGLPLDR